MDVTSRFDVVFDLPVEINDGNMFFDSITTTSVVVHVIRKNKTVIWHKLYMPFYDADVTSFGKLHHDPLDYYQTETHRKRIRRNYFQLALIKLDANIESLSSSCTTEHDIVAITMRFGTNWLPETPTSKGETVNIIFDILNRKIYAKNLSHPKQKWKVDEIFSSLIGLNLRATIDYKIINIQANIKTNHRLLSPVLLDLIMLNPSLRAKFRYSESVFMKKNSEYDYKLLYEGISLSFSVSKVVKMTNITIDSVSNDYLEVIKADLLFLINEFQKEALNIIDSYDIVLPSPHDSLRNMLLYEDKIDDRDTLEYLRASVPELFVTGYSRECTTKPFIVTPEEADEIMKLGGETLVYPDPNGPFAQSSRIYACKKGFYPGLKLNKLSNRDKFEFIPVCYIGNKHRDRSSYNAANERPLRTKINLPLKSGTLGKLPWLIEALFCTSANILKARRGISPGPFSSLECIKHFYKDKNQPGLLSLKALKEGKTDYFDPFEYRRELEKLCNADLYIFEMTESFQPSLCVDETDIGWTPRPSKPICILVLKMVIPFHCELLEGLDSALLAAYKIKLISLLSLKKQSLSSIVIADTLEANSNVEKAYFLHDML